MTHRRFYFAALCILVAFLSASYQAAQYHIDFQKDFDRFREQDFLPDDEILFKCGSRLSGMFAPAGVGTAAAPIRIETHGKGERPRIDALRAN